MAKWCSPPTQQRNALSRTICDLRSRHRPQSAVLRTAVPTRLQKSDASISGRACLQQPSMESSDPRTVRKLASVLCLRINLGPKLAVCQRSGPSHAALVFCGHTRGAVSDVTSSIFICIGICKRSRCMCSLWRESSERNRARITALKLSSANWQPTACLGLQSA